MNFGQTLGKFTNPIAVDFGAWPVSRMSQLHLSVSSSMVTMFTLPDTGQMQGGFKLKVLVKDSDDVNNDDEMEKIYAKFSITPHRPFLVAPYIEHTLNGTRTRATPGR